MENLTDKERAEFEKLRKQKQKQLKRQNEYVKQNYDRIGLAIPKGQKAIIENRAKEKGFKTITEYLKALIDSDLKSPGSLNEITTDPQQDHGQN